MADEIRATPQNRALGAIAAALRRAQQFAGQYQVDPRVPLLGGTGVDELLSLPGAASLMEDVSYNGPRALIRGGNVATGGLGTFRIDPRVADVADVALNVSPLGMLAAKGAKAGTLAAGRAGEQIAERFVPQIMERGGAGAQALQALAGGTRSQVVKPKGGNWLSGSVEEAVRPLRQPTPGVGTPWEEANTELNAPRQALNKWLETKLAKYIKNEMSTPEDPLRLQADAFVARKAEQLAAKDAQIAKAVADMEAARQARGFTPEMMTSSQARIRDLQRERDFIEAQTGLHAEIAPTRYNITTPRERAGFPAEGMGLSPTAKLWEDRADTFVNQLRASDFSYYPEVKEANPWLSKVPPETRVYEMLGGADRDLGFGHLTDELRNALNPESGLPRELLLKYSDLDKMSVPQVARRVDEINAWRSVQKAEADAARAGNAATQVFKEYPEQGMRWVELRKPESTGKKTTVGRSELDELGMGVDDATLREVAEEMAFDEGLVQGTRAFDEFVEDTMRAHNTKVPVEVDESVKILEDALKYEGEVMGHCVGGYCPDVIEGRSRIYSLRDKKGQPHVTIEVAPRPIKTWDDVTAAVGKEQAAKLWQEFDDIGGNNMSDVGEGFDIFIKNKGIQPAQDIVQIKGKANRAPKEEYLPAVQDFVRSQQWGKIGDLQNTGLVQLPDKRLITKEQFDEGIQRLTGEGEPSVNAEWFQRQIKRDPSWWDQASGAFEGFARGGAVRGYAAGGAVKAAKATVKSIGELVEKYTPEFRQWFAGSKAATPEGEPLQVYRGTTKDEGEVIKNGWFAKDPEVASMFSMKRERIEDFPNSVVTPVHLKMKRPLVIDAKGATWDRIPFGDPRDKLFMSSDKIAQFAKEEKYDGVIFKNINESDDFFDVEPTDVFVTFNPNQAKSVFNKKPTSDPRVGYATGGLVSGALPYDAAKIDQLALELTA